MKCGGRDPQALCINRTDRPALLANHR
jgi:hypothetical protein